MPTQKPTRTKKAAASKRVSRGRTIRTASTMRNSGDSRLESSRMYPNKWIAWSPGHDRVVTAGDTFAAACDEAERLGYDVQTLIYESPPPYTYTYE